MENLEEKKFENVILNFVTLKMFKRIFQCILYCNEAMPTLHNKINLAI